MCEELANPARSKGQQLDRVLMQIKAQIFQLEIHAAKPSDWVSDQLTNFEISSPIFLFNHPKLIISLYLDDQKERSTNLINRTANSCDRSYLIATIVGWNFSKYRFHNQLRMVGKLYLTCKIFLKRWGTRTSYLPSLWYLFSLKLLKDSVHWCFERGVSHFWGIGLEIEFKGWESHITYW